MYYLALRSLRSFSLQSKEGFGGAAFEVANPADRDNIKGLAVVPMVVIRGLFSAIDASALRDRQQKPEAHSQGDNCVGIFSSLIWQDLFAFLAKIRLVMAAYRQRFAAPLATHGGLEFAESAHSGHHLGQAFIIKSATSIALHIIDRPDPIADVVRVPPHQLVAADLGNLGQKRDSRSRDGAALFPVLNGLVADTHLPSHISQGIEVSEGSFECWVHVSCFVDEFETIVAQEALVAQVEIQLPQGLLAGIFSS